MVNRGEFPSGQPNQPMQPSRERSGMPKSWDEARETGVVAGAAWMVAISLVLFFLPLINGLVGGLVGGYKIGTVGRAIIAALLPAVVVAIGLWILLGVLGLPVVGAVAGAAIGIWVLLADLGLLAGAVIGGAIGPDRGRA